MARRYIRRIKASVERQRAIDAEKRERESQGEGEGEGEGEEEGCID